jgi:hypothetical protein
VRSQLLKLIAEEERRLILQRIPEAQLAGNGATEMSVIGDQNSVKGKL